MSLRQQAPLNLKAGTSGPRTTVRNEFPLSELVFPDNFYMYMDHLNSLGLAGIWQLGAQEPILENGTQTGVFINNAIRLTVFGETFAKACVPDTMEPHWAHKSGQGAEG